ncbi:calcium-binding protein [Microvirga sp. 0TCS3.31]
MTALSNGTFLFVGKVGVFPDAKLKAWIYNADGSLKAEQILDVPDHKVPGVYGELDMLAINPIAAEMPDGEIAITWTVDTPSSGDTYVAPWVCIYSADLAPVGVPQPIFDPISGARDYAESVVALDDGTLVISARNGLDGHAYLRVFGPDGTRSAALDLGLAGSSVPGAILTDVAALANGNVAVVVRESTSSLKGYVLTPSGIGGPTLSTPFSISTSISPIKAGAKVTALKGGGFVVTWTDRGLTGLGEPEYVPFVQVFDAQANPLGNKTPVAAGKNEWAVASDVVALPNGGFVIAYEKATRFPAGTAISDVYLAIFDAAGSRLSADLLLNEVTSEQSTHIQEVSLLADGRIVVRYSGGSEGIRIVDPRGEAVSLTGTDKSDQYIGTAFNDTLDGGAGADILSGGSGNDFVSFTSAKAGVVASLSGGSGGDAAGDTYISIEGILGSSFGDVFTGNGSAILKGRSGDDIYSINAGDVVEEVANEGRDTVIVGGSYTLRADAEIEVLKLSGVSSKRSANLTGSNTANEITGHTGKNTLKGQGGNDVLKASSGNDVLYGGSGADKLYGGAGNDKLYGGTGTGKDVFVFDTKPSKSTNVDRIYDFNPKYDSVQLEDKIFTKLGKGSSKGVKFKADMFVKGDTAKDKEDRIIYDNKTGALYYDQDGTGAKAQVKIATLSKNLKLTYHDFFVI